jgi:hypothetical protein
MCFKKKAPSKETQQQQQAAEQTAAAVAEEQAQAIADVRAAKTEDIQAEAPLTEKEIKMGKRGGTGRRTLLVSGAGGAGYLSRFAQAGSRLWG